jgi:fucose 4-O-acetylase-like acetyltransferase
LFFQTKVVSTLLCALVYGVHTVVIWGVRKMKYRMFSLATWVSADPRRVYLVLLLIAVMMMLLVSALPSGAAFAGWASGTGD